MRDGDRVKQGDIVVRLDDTVTRANLAIVTKGLDELYARKARLESERDGDSTVKFPADLLARAERSRCRRDRRGERKLFELRQHARAPARRRSFASGSSSSTKRFAASRRSSCPRKRKSS